MKPSEIPELFRIKNQAWFTRNDVIEIGTKIIIKCKELLGVDEDMHPPKKPTKTEMMFNARSPYSNCYQGDDRRVLFVCSAGILRSATAARIYSGKYNTRAAGSKYYAVIPVTEELLLWAQEIVFVNRENLLDIEQKYDLKEFDAKITVLNIEDDYEHMNPELLEILQQQYEKV